MFTAAFWKATFERMVRGGAIAAAAAWSGDAVFNVMEVTNLQDVVSLFVSGAVLSGLLCLAGNVVTNSGPSFNNTETIDPVAPERRELGQSLVLVLVVVAVVVLFFLLLFPALRH